MQEEWKSDFRYPAMSDGPDKAPPEPESASLWGRRPRGEGEGEGKVQAGMNAT